MTKKLVIITGLTGSGKSGLAVKLAKEFNGEIISADSVQIYRGLNIGSAKEDKEVMKQIPHHLIDIKNFDENYNVGEFVEDCKKAVEDVISRNKLPIIVGGTGLYVKALVNGYSLGDKKADLEYRAELTEIAQKNGNEFVWNMLNELNPDKAKTVHFNNLKRVIRYIELEKNGAEVLNNDTFINDYQVCIVGIVAEREYIYSRINQRVDIMLNMGLEQEVKALIDNGATRETQSLNSIGYREWFDYFEGKQSKENTIDLIKQHTRNYCKRQLTFMKTMPKIKMETLQNAEVVIKEFLNDNN